MGVRSVRSDVAGSEGGEKASTGECARSSEIQLCMRWSLSFSSAMILGVGESNTDIETRVNSER